MRFTIFWFAHWLYLCCCCLPCNHCSIWTWVVKEIFAFLVVGCVLRTAGRFFIWNYAGPLTLLKLLNYYLTLAWLWVVAVVNCHIKWAKTSWTLIRMDSLTPRLELEPCLYQFQRWNRIPFYIPARIWFATYLPNKWIFNNDFKMQAHDYVLNVAIK